MAEVSQLMAALPFTLFGTIIRKQVHLELHGEKALNPYELALEFTMDRVRCFLLEQQETSLPWVAEARGKQEDKSLELAFQRIRSGGTRASQAEGFKTLNCPLVFRSKRDNIAGLQVADLSAYPCARQILDPAKSNPAYDIVRQHFYGGISAGGVQVFP